MREEMGKEKMSRIKIDKKMLAEMAEDVLVMHKALDVCASSLMALSTFLPSASECELEESNLMHLMESAWYCASKYRSVAESVYKRMKKMGSHNEESESESESDVDARHLR